MELLDTAFTRDTGNPLIAPGTQREDFAGLSTELPSTRWTQTTAWAGSTISGKSITAWGAIGDFASATSSAVAAASSSATAYLYDREYNKGRSAGLNFRYSGGACSVGIIACGSEDGSGFDGYLCRIEQVSGTSHRCVIYRYTNGSPTTLYTSDAFTLTANKWYYLSFGSVGPHLWTWLRGAWQDGDWTNAVHYKRDLVESTYTEGRTGLYLASSTVDVTFYDSGCDAWYALDFQPFLINGEHDAPYRDDLGRYWGLVRVGGAVSDDQIALAYCDSLGGPFTYRHDGTDGICAPIIERTSGTTWDSCDTQECSNIYDSASGTFKVWYMGNLHEPGTWGDHYNIGYAYCSPDANGAPGDAIADWTKHGIVLQAAESWEIHAGYDGVWYPQVLKRSYTHAGTPYAYVMVYSSYVSPGQQFGVAFSNDGITWVKHASNPVYTPPTTNYYPNQLLYAEAKWCILCMAIGEAAVGAAITTSDFATFSVENSGFIARGASGEWDESRVSDFTLVKYGGRALLYYGGSNAVGEQTTGPQLWVGLASHGLSATADTDHIDIALAGTGPFLLERRVV